jgi:hypothetical protein
LIDKRSLAVAFGVALAMLAAPVAAAEPVTPADPAVPVAADPEPASSPAPSQLTAAVPVVQSEAVSHLPSPDSLPPGTTQTAPERRTLGYLRDIWQAVRTEDVTMGDALLLLAQRPMDSDEPATAPQQRPPVGAPLP